MSSLDRSQLLASIHSHLSERIEAMYTDLRDLQDATSSNYKSTAGDKHDTEREMVRMEMDNLAKRIENEQRMLHQVEQCAGKNPTEKVATGSFVQTKDHLLFIGSAFGLLHLEKQAVMGISELSPVGNALLGKKHGETVDIHSRSYRILRIL